nr:gem-associated protein 6 [Danio rerio]|eukprot:XP_003199591.3 gem-associated protein 6 [Danio rerio]
MQRWVDMSPRQWQEFINQEVCVSARDQHSFTGRVFTVDPVSASVVLVSLDEAERPAVTLVLGHAVSDVQVLSAGSEQTLSRMRSVFLQTHTPTHTLSADELQRRRESVRRWLQDNRIPVQEDGELLRVAHALTISAPYRPGDCSCANQIILARVQSLLENNPETSGDALTTESTQGSG